MSIWQYLQVLWARRWVCLGLFLLTSGAGIAFALLQPPRYIAEVSMLVDVKPDPILGMMGPGLAQPGFMATQAEMLTSDRVASRVVKMLGIDRSETAVQQWRADTGAKVPIERYFAGMLVRGLTVEPSRGSNFINIIYTAPDPKFATAAANAFAQAYLDISVEMRVEPARQYAVWFDEQSKVLRADLEQAQSKLSKYQQDKGITDERLEQETARLNMLIGQLATAQAERADASSRQQGTGSEMSPDIQQSPAVQGLKSQLATAQTRLIEISANVGSNHPQRIALEAQIAEIKQQLGAEMRRVSGGTAAATMASARKLGELQALVDQQKARVLQLRNARDDIQVLVKDVENAQRAYEGARSRLSQLNLESQTNQANVRVMSPAIEPTAPSQKNTLKSIVVAVIGGLVVGIGVALGLEMLDRRVRSPEDLLAVEGVPVLGVLRPPGSKQPAYRRLGYGQGPPPRSALPALGAP
jgi:chain length determinant protein EpsF